jgi:hypothetical protein
MDLLSVFNPPTSDRARVEHNNNALPVGSYIIARTCEYCGSETTDHCTQDCQRPKSFFRKKRPPFSPKGADWESKTDYEIVRPKKTTVLENGGVTDTETHPHPHGRSSLQWMTGIFSNGGFE